MKVDFDGLQAFVCVAELGSFIKAAHDLHITQTALTRRIQKLEALVGIKLMDRTTRRVELTELGRDFLPQARNIVADATRAVERLQGKVKQGQGHFTLACVPSLTTHVLPLLIVMQVVQMLIQLAVTGNLPGWLYFAQSIVATLIWPVVCWLLLAPQRRAVDRDETRPI